MNNLYDRCYECQGNGDDYFINDDGDLECYCPKCSANLHNESEGLNV